MCLSFPGWTVQDAIFSTPYEDWRLYYAPGYMIKVHREQVAEFDRQLRLPQAEQLITHELWQAARRAQQKASLSPAAAFEPVCLTLYLNQSCNLNCAYCFSNLDGVDTSTLSEQAIRAATELVAGNCARKHQPLAVIFHGGGELVLAWKLIDRLQPVLKDLAAQHGIRLFRYIATNGVMSESRARWLAESFELVGLSCDGPEDIQAQQRPMRVSGKSSTAALERTARVLAEAGRPVQVRVTLTPQTASRQAKICAYICEKLKPGAVHVEPVYSGGRAQVEALIANDALEGFVQSYLQAQAVARSYGTTWEMSASRRGETHGAYCNIFRQVLNLIPGDVATACFKTVNAQQAAAKQLVVGAYHAKQDAFSLDHARIAELQAGYTRPAMCADCFLASRCTHNCPNACPLTGEPGSDVLCRLLKLTAARQLIEAAAPLLQDSAPVMGASLKW